MSEQQYRLRIVDINGGAIDEGNNEATFALSELDEGPSVPTREQIDSVVGAVLFNVSNYPEAAQSRLWGRDIAPLRQKVTDAVLALLNGARDE